MKFSKRKQLIINREKLETRVALVHNGRLEEYQIERNTEENLVGSVFMGKIVNHEPSLQAAFVDIGYGKNAFLHYRDFLPASYDMAKVRDEVENISKEESSFTEESGQILNQDISSGHIKELKKNRYRERIRIEDIPRLFPVGSEVLVQVSKGPIGTKGPRATTNIAIPGRYLVLLPLSDHLGLSKKIEDPKERARLRNILLELNLPRGMGFICRTVAEGRKSVFLKHDLDMLLGLWQRVEDAQKKPKAPYIVYREPGILERTMRDFLTEEMDEIIVDDNDAYQYIRTFLGKIVGGSMAGKVSLYKKTGPIFEYYGIEKQISDIFERQIPLPSGGYICIDETEALISIDVNSGSSRGKDHAETILKNNLEACDEIARQLRLRNVGGLVVNDFIDMYSQKHRDMVLKRMRSLVKDDRARSKILPISRLGLMEMTRQREQESLQETVYDPCPYCNGRGKVKSAMSMSVEIQRKLQEVLRLYKHEKGFSVRVIMHPAVLARMKNEDAHLLSELEKKYGKQLSFRGDPSIHLQEFRLIDPETGVGY